jgi:energy-coupling factor transporter ATP-binding protein EcfA2
MTKEPGRGTSATTDRAGNPEDFYSARLRTLADARSIETRAVSRVSGFRMLAFGLFLACVISFDKWGHYRLIAGVLAGSCVLFFAMLVRRSDILKARIRLVDEKMDLATQALRRIARDWSGIARSSWEPPPDTHPYAADLDLFGHASLVQLLPRVSRSPGRPTLRAWLLDAASPSELRKRNEAITELIPAHELRDILSAYGARVPLSATQTEHLSRWSEQVGVASHQSALVRIGAWIAPIALCVLGLATYLLHLPNALWIVPLMLCGALTLRYAPELKKELGGIAGYAIAIKSFADLARVIVAADFSSELLGELKKRLSAGDTSAATAMRSLGTLAECEGIRASPMMHFILQLFTLWDFHLVFALARWRKTFGHEVRFWLESIGIVESLAALATLAHDNPEWHFAEIDDAGPKCFQAESLAHPLLPPERCVANDVSVGPEGTVLTITGSNMSGKSTLLRSIGLNLVLAHAGSVVCAATLRCPSITLLTSLRVQDSLENGVSYFMAELQRLKLIVDTADRQRSSGANVLYLLDEIFQGTNSAERSIAARQVLAHLIASEAIGAVTTHDLQLFDSPLVAAFARHVHFEESFTTTGAPTMSFDYRLKSGPATSTNALKLMELVGLPMRPSL